MRPGTVLLFGAGGQLGSALQRAYADAKVVGLRHAELDIGDAEAIARTIEASAPDLIVNAAAYNAVERAGEELEAAYRANAFGPYYIARAAGARGIPFVHVSTDYVFDGAKGEYRESDVPNPVNAYGASKHAGEELVRIAYPGSFIVRTSALFGAAEKEGKRNFVLAMLEKGKGGRVRVVDDQRMAPTYAEDLAVAIVALMERGAAPGIYHAANAGSATWAEFAEEIFRLRGMDVSVERIATAESGTKIRRPASTVLMSEKGVSLPLWQDALERYLKTL